MQPLNFILRVNTTEEKSIQIYSKNIGETLVVNI